MISPTSSGHAGKEIWLAADTSGRQGSLCLTEVDQDGVQGKAWEVFWDKKSTHSEIATLKLQEVLQFSGLGFDDIDRLLINIGPGSFTGLRVGVSLIRTLAYSLNIPVMMVNTLEVLAAFECGPQEKVFVAIKAIQNFYYGAGYEFTPTGLRELVAPQSLDLKQIENLSAGYTKVLVEGEAEDFDFQTMAGHTIEFALANEGASRLFSWNDVKPLYIRASEAEEKLKAGLLKPL